MDRALIAENESLKAALAAALARADQAEAEASEVRAKATEAEAKVSDVTAQVALLKLEIAKLKRQIHGPRSERTKRLLDQLELDLDELESKATEDDLAAEAASAQATRVKSFTRRKGGRKPFPAHLPRERVVVEAPKTCSCCGSERLRKLGEDVTETLEVIPRQWKVIQTVREKVTCRDCERISQPPAPFHATPRGWAGPNLLAMILFEKYGQHQPLNRQSERYAREGLDLSLSTLADQVGACAFQLRPLHDLVGGPDCPGASVVSDEGGCDCIPLFGCLGTEYACHWAYETNGCELDPSCSPGYEQTFTAGCCDDGTPPGECSAEQPDRCSPGSLSLIPDAASCGCPNGMVPDGNDCAPPSAELNVSVTIKNKVPTTTPQGYTGYKYFFDLNLEETNGIDVSFNYVSRYLEIHGQLPNRDSSWISGKCGSTNLPGNGECLMMNRWFSSSESKTFFTKSGTVQTQTEI